MQRVFEELTVDGEKILLEHAEVPIDQVHLDEENPRIRYRLALEKGTKSLDDVILGMPEVSKLKKDIYANGGLRERVILRKNGNGYVVPEGNCRTVCYRSLKKGNNILDSVKPAIARRPLPL